MAWHGGELTTASDEAIEAFFTEAGFDGTWSMTTKLSVLAAAGTGLPLFLNYLWAMTPQTYRCPICQRSKPELVEKTATKLVAHLCLDHDHIVDFINLVAREHGIAGDLKPLYDTFMAFTPTIICNSCNAIDSTVKARHPDIDPYFTFSPAQKARIFKPYKRSHHWVYQKKSLAIWQEAKEIFIAKKESIPTAVHDYIGLTRSSFHYRRYVDDSIKAKFAELLPIGGSDCFHAFIKRSTANGNVAAF